MCHDQGFIKEVANVGNFCILTGNFKLLLFYKVDFKENKENSPEVSI